MFKPLNNRILVRPDVLPKETQTASGIILPSEKEEKALTGIAASGSHLVASGERVLFSAYGWDEAVIEGETFYLVSEASILGIF